MRLTTLSCSLVLAAACLALPAAAVAQKETETVNRTVPFPNSGTLQLNNFSGRVLITGTTGRDVVVKAVRRAERDRLDHIKLDVRTEGSTVVIDANKRDDNWRERNNNVVDTEFEIGVPNDAGLRIDCFSSDVEIRSVSGEQKVHTFSGNLTVRDAKGALNLDTFSGKIDVDLTPAGVSPDLRSHTFSGDITVRLAGDAKGEVDFTSHSGDFESDMPVLMRASRGRHVSAALPGGSAGHQLTFDTFSGSVRIRK